MSGIFIRSPFYIIPTYRATENTLKICNRKFGHVHHLDTKANAFRHALWNFMLCKSYFQVSGSTDEALKRTKSITDLHEQLMPNREIAKIMDLHNNKIGRNLFSQDNDLNIVSKLEEMLKSAKRLSSISEIDQENENLVYLED